MIKIDNYLLKELINSILETDKEEFNENDINQIIKLDIDGEEFNSNDLHDLDKLTNLKELNFYNVYVTEEMMINIKSLTKVNKISFYNSTINSLDLIQKLSLINLVIDSCEIELEELVFINNLSNLEELVLDSLNIEIDLKNLSIIKKLKKFSLANDVVINEEFIIYMNEVESLRIDGSGIMDLSIFLSFDNLKVLIIDETQYLENKDIVKMLVTKGIKVVDNMNQSVVGIDGK